MLLLRRKIFRRSKQRQNHLFSLNVSLICSVYSRFLSLDHWPGDVSDIQFQTRNSQGRSFFLSKIALCSFFLPVFPYLFLESHIYLPPSPIIKIPLKEILLRFICPASLKQVYIPAFPRICCRSSLVPHNLWETLTTVCTNEKKWSLHYTTKEILWLSKCTSTNTYIVE